MPIDNRHAAREDEASAVTNGGTAPMPARETLVIIPAYHEAASITTVVAGVRRHAPACDLLVVDDGSTDRTAALARQAGARVVAHPFNLGYGAALQTGYKYAYRHGYAFVVQLDGDGQHEPACIPGLLEVVQHDWADLAIGSRFLVDRPYDASPVRRLGIRLLGALTSRLIGQRVTDPTSGFQALNRRAITLLVDDAFPIDFPDADVLVMLHLAGLRIKEVPVMMYPRGQGRSMHDGLRPLYYLFKMCLSLGMTLLRERRSHGEGSG